MSAERRGDAATRRRGDDAGDLTRREVLGIMAAVPFAAAIDPHSIRLAGEAARKAVLLRERGSRYEPKFFTPHEWATIAVLVDMVIPRDERSGSATDAGVPEFMDFMMLDRPYMQTPMRGGLGWLDTEMRERHDVAFIEATEAQRAALLDEIAWPAKAPERLAHGVAFFNDFRDLTATGFFSSKMGVEDLRYTGNTYVQEWTGCPPETLERLGVSYDLLGEDA